MHRITLLAAAAALVMATAAQADELRAIEGRSFTLGPVSGIVYFVRNGSDDDVVATLTAGRDATTVRFETSLVAGHSARISIPRGPADTAIAVRITREGDRLFISQDDPS